jgi:hypothetical protein
MNQYMSFLIKDSLQNCHDDLLLSPHHSTILIVNDNAGSVLTTSSSSSFKSKGQESPIPNGNEEVNDFELMPQIPSLTRMTRPLSPQKRIRRSVNKQGPIAFVQNQSTLLLSSRTYQPSQKLQGQQQEQQEQVPILRLPPIIPCRCPLFSSSNQPPIMPIRQPSSS